MTTANKITILRILAVPFFVVQFLYYVDTGIERYRWMAFACFVFAAICDGVDGYIARRFHQKSELGAILDPLADKLLLVSAVVLLTLHNNNYVERIPLWLTGLIIGRDAILILGLGIIYYSVGRVQVRPNFLGKTTTVFQMILVIWILLRGGASWLRIWCVATGLATGISGALYLFQGVRQLSNSPTSSAFRGRDGQ